MKATKPQTLEQICDGKITFYDKDQQVRCGQDLSHDNIRCPYYEGRYCLNEFYTKTIIKYNNK